MTFKSCRVVRKYPDRTPIKHTLHVKVVGRDLRVGLRLMAGLIPTVHCESLVNTNLLKPYYFHCEAATQLRNMGDKWHYCYEDLSKKKKKKIKRVWLRKERTPRQTLHSTNSQHSLTTFQANFHKADGIKIVALNVQQIICLFRQKNLQLLYLKFHWLNRSQIHTRLLSHGSPKTSFWQRVSTVTVCLHVANKLVCKQQKRSWFLAVIAWKKSKMPFESQGATEKILINHCAIITQSIFDR